MHVWWQPAAIPEYSIIYSLAFTPYSLFVRYVGCSVQVSITHSGNCKSKLQCYIQRIVWGTLDPMNAYLAILTILSKNEDCGQMSAWFLFSALGFYPVDPLSGDYIVGSYVNTAVCNIQFSITDFLHRHTVRFSTGSRSVCPVLSSLWKLLPWVPRRSRM